MPQIPAEFTTERMATERQVAYIKDLLFKRDLFKDPRWFDRVNAMDKDEYAAYLRQIADGVSTEATTFADARRKLDWLLALPELSAQDKAALFGNATSVPDGSAGIGAIPDGRYALEDPEDELNPVKFYRVKRGKDLTARGGKDWTNFLFVTRFASDEEYPVKHSARIAVLREIAKDAKVAALRFGREENACCICGRRLTRRLSRELGIGPVCGARNGWLTEMAINVARERIVMAGYDPEEEVT